MSWVQALEYRVDALVACFAIFTGLLIEYMIWAMIFSNTAGKTINGFTFKELIVYIFLCLIVGQLKSSWHTAGEMIEQIRTGELNKYLMKPISFFLYNFMNFLGYNSVFYLVYFFLIILFPFLFPNLIFHNILEIIGFGFSLILAIYLSYCIYFILVCCAFWLSEVRVLLVSYNITSRILSGTIIPLALYPKFYLKIIQYSPIPYLVDFPVSIATGRLDISLWWKSFLIAFLWCVIMTLIGHLIYKKGIKVYEGFGY